MRDQGADAQADELFNEAQALTGKVANYRARALILAGFVRDLAAAERWADALELADTLPLNIRMQLLHDLARPLLRKGNPLAREVLCHARPEPWDNLSFKDMPWREDYVLLCMEHRLHQLWLRGYTPENDRPLIPWPQWVAATQWKVVTQPGTEDGPAISTDRLAVHAHQFTPIGAMITFTLDGNSLINIHMDDRASVKQYPLLKIRRAAWEDLIDGLAGAKQASAVARILELMPPDMLRSQIARQLGNALAKASAKGSARDLLAAQIPDTAFATHRVNLAMVIDHLKTLGALAEAGGEIQTELDTALEFAELIRYPRLIQIMAQIEEGNNDMCELFTTEHFQIQLRQVETPLRQSNFLIPLAQVMLAAGHTKEAKKLLGDFHAAVESSHPDLGLPFHIHSVNHKPVFFTTKYGRNRLQQVKWLGQLALAYADYPPTEYEVPRVKTSGEDFLFGIAHYREQEIDRNWPPARIAAAQLIAMQFEGFHPMIARRLTEKGHYELAIEVAFQRRLSQNTVKTLIEITPIMIRSGKTKLAGKALRLALDRTHDILLLNEIAELSDWSGHGELAQSCRQKAWTSARGIESHPQRHLACRAIAQSLCRHPIPSPRGPHLKTAFTSAEQKLAHQLAKAFR